MPIQVPTVQGCPATVRPLDPVGHHQMGVQQRVALSRCPVVEPNGQQSPSGHMLMSAMAAAGPQVLVQVADRLGQPSMMGGQDGSAGGRVTEAVEDRDALGRPQDHIKGRHRRTDLLPLNDGRFLRLSVSLYLAIDDERGRLLKVDKSSYQYQADQAGNRWIFRYDYLREPGPDPHPQAHLQIRGTLTEGAALPEDRTLARIHFPTGRVSIESVIRLLADQFGVACNEPPETWRPVLAEAERTFPGRIALLRRHLVPPGEHFLDAVHPQPR
jgi:hypothetical protein